ncbi:MAG: tetratricopeptide repeat protein [Bacteroidales bacterium]|nr:tetratricopeptide repeat protein [Bacteroidales bacterium]
MKRLISIALLSFLFFSTTVAQINTDRMMDIGRNALYFEDYVLSIQYFNQVILSKPHLADSYFYRATAKLYLDDYAGAEDDCTKALERNNFIMKAYLIRGFCRMKTGNYDGAVEDCNKGMEFDPDNKAFLDYKGLSLLSAKRYPEAKVCLNEMIRRYPNDPEGYAARGQLNIECKDTLAAIDDFSRCIAVDKNNAVGWNARGWVYLLKDKYSNAVADLNEAIRINAENAWSYMNRGLARYHLNDLKGSLEDYDKSISLDPNSKLAYFNRGLTRSYVGDLNRAVEDFDKAIELEPTDYLAIYNRGIIRQQVGDYVGAVADFTAIIGKYPKFTPAYYQRSDVYKKMGDAKKADRDYFAAWGMEDKAKQEKASGKKKKAVESEAKSQEDVTADTTKQMFDINKYNRMLISSTINKDKKVYQDPMRGRVQNINTEFDLEGMYNMTYYEKSRPGPVRRIMDISKYQTEILNNSIKSVNKLLVSNKEEAMTSRQVDAHFSSVTDYSEQIGKTPDNAALYLLRGLDFALLQDYTDAMADFNKAISLNDKFVLAYFGRASLRYRKMLVEYADNKVQEEVRTEPLKSGKQNTVGQNDVSKDAGDMSIGEKAFGTDYYLIIQDLDRVLALDPRFVYAYYNKGNIRCLQRDFRSALIDYTKALQINPDFADAWFNRGLAQIKLGDRERGLSDLRMAGQLGMYRAYNIIKRLGE